MSDAFHLTDDAIRDVLLARSGSPMPVDLPAAVLRAVREARADGIRADRPRRTRIPFLLLAAAVTLGSLVAIGSLAGARNETVPLPSVVPATPLPNAPAAAGATSCTQFDTAAHIGGENLGPAPVPGATPEQPANGLVLTFGDPQGDVPAVFAPFAASPAPSPIADWTFDSMAVSLWRASPDGTVAAAELWTGGCPNDVFVMRTDGTGLRRPFTVAGHDAYAPAWSPDGRYLAAVVGPSSLAVDPAPSGVASVMLWDAATGDVRDLGQPCDRCQPVGAPNTDSGTMVWSPDSRWIAVDSTDLSCGEASTPPPGNYECRAVAIVTPGGQWRMVPIADDGQTGAAVLVGWSDPRTLLVARGGRVATLDIETGLVTDLPIEADGLLTPLSRALSPDRTKLLRVTGSAPYLDILDVASGRSTRIEPVPPDILESAWSPDSKWIMVLADTDGFGANLGMYLAPVDGSAAPRLVLPGSFGAMTWLPAGP